MSISYKYSILICFLFLITSCNKSPKCWGKKEKSEGIIEADINPCLNCNILVNENSSFVINSENEYLKLASFAHNNQTACEFMPINFNIYTLLGKTIWSNCKSKIKRHVSNDIENKKYIFTIELKECGNCAEQNIINNWILVPKIPVGYSVDFVFLRK